MHDADKTQARAAILRVIEGECLHLKIAIKGHLKKHGITANLDELAEDVLQDLVVDLVGRANDGRLLGIRSMVGYLYNAARLGVKCYLRDKARERDRPRGSETFWATTDGRLADAGLSPSEVRELEEAILECFQKLAGKQRMYMEIILEHYDAPISESEIAGIHGVSPGSVRSVVLEARRNLAECLGKKGYMVPPRAKGVRP